VKSTIVWVYTGAAAAHVFTAELSQMWSVLLSSVIFFLVLVVLLLLDETPYRHAQNLIAYLVYVLGTLLYAVLVLVDCSQGDPVVCAYLYPVSTARVVEASIGVGLLFVHFIATLWAVVALSFVRKYLRTALSYGGVFYASNVVTTLFFVQAYGALTSCANDTELHTRIGASAALTFSVVGCVGCITYAAPSLLSGQNPDLAITWDDLQKSDAEHEQHSTRYFQLSLAIGTAISALSAVFSMVFGLYSLGTGIVSLTITAIGALAPVTRWWLNRRDGDHEDPQTNTAAARQAVAASSRAYAPTHGAAWGDNRRWPHLHKNV
jgi:hypothetical protein